MKFVKTSSSNEQQTLSEQTLFSALISKRLDHYEKNLDLDGKKPKSASTAEEIIKLDIPDLPEDSGLMQWQIPGSQTYEWINYAQVAQNLIVPMSRISASTHVHAIAVDSGISSDEGGGAASNKCSPTSRPIAAGNDDVWELTLRYQLSNYTDWDMKKTYFTQINILNEL